MDNKPKAKFRRPSFKTKQVPNTNKSTNSSRSINDTKKKDLVYSTLKVNNRTLASNLNQCKVSINLLQKRVNELNGENLELRRELAENRATTSTEFSEFRCSCNVDLEVEHQNRLVKFLEPLKSCIHAAIDSLQPLSENLGSALNIIAGPGRKSKSLSAITFRENRSQLQSKESKDDSKNNIGENEKFTTTKEQNIVENPISEKPDGLVSPKRKASECQSYPEISPDVIRTQSSSTYENPTIALNITTAPRRKSKSPSTMNIRESRSELQRKLSNKYGKNDNVSVLNCKPTRGENKKNAKREEPNSTQNLTSETATAGGRPYKCLEDGCMKSYMTPGYLKRHTIKSHSSTDPSKDGKNDNVSGRNYKPISSINGKDTKRKEQTNTQNLTSETADGLIGPKRKARQIGVEQLQSECCPKEITPDISYTQRNQTAEPKRPKRQASFNKSYTEPRLGTKLRRNQ